MVHRAMLVSTASIPPPAPSSLLVRSPSAVAPPLADYEFGVASPAVAILVLSAVAYAVFRLLGRRALGKTSPGSSLRRAALVGLPLVAVGSLFGVVVAGLPALAGDAVTAVGPPVDGTPAGAAAVQFVTGLGVLVPVLAGFLGLLPAIRESRDVDVGAGRVTRLVGRFLVVLLALLVVVLQAFVALREFTSLAAGLVASMLALVVLALAGAPLLIRLSRRTREPTAAEADRLDDLLATADLSVRGVRVFDASEEEAGLALVRGVPGFRTLFVTDYLLDETDDERARAVVAVAAGQARYGFVAYRVLVAALAVLGLGLELLDGRASGLARAVGLPGPVGLVALLAVVAALLAGGERLVYRVDAYAADHVGARTLADTLERFAEKYELRYDAGRLASLLAMRPPVGRRIDRLYAGAADPE